MILFDTETDGLENPTKFHCLSWTCDGKSVQTLTNQEDMYELVLMHDTIIGHNIALYDLYHMKRILNLNWNGMIIDTLWLSWYLDPKRIKHGLEDYGVEFGYPKVKVESHEWSEGNMDLMIERCERDVEINWKLWMKLKNNLEQLYG